MTNCIQERLPDEVIKKILVHAVDDVKCRDFLEVLVKEREKRGGAD